MDSAWRGFDCVVLCGFGFLRGFVAVVGRCLMFCLRVVGMIGLRVFAMMSGSALCCCTFRLFVVLLCVCVVLVA